MLDIDGSDGNLAQMTQFFRLPGAARRDPMIDLWFATGEDELRRFARPWFDRMRACGPDVRELLHDGHPTTNVQRRR